MSLAVETLKEQLNNVIKQRDSAQHTYIQCLGAITILSEQINMCHAAECAAQQEDKQEELNQGDLPDERVEC
jgi:hypothetical protein